jgi:hypothetical protein
MPAVEVSSSTASSLVVHVFATKRLTAGAAAWYNLSLQAAVKNLEMPTFAIELVSLTQDKLGWSAVNLAG